MIEIVPEVEQDSSEYRAALELAETIGEAWPMVKTKPGYRVQIFVSPQCHSQRTKDIDLVLLLDFERELAFDERGDRGVSRLCTVIEVKDHSDVVFRNQNVVVEYLDRASGVPIEHDATDQIAKQIWSLKAYLEGCGEKAPFVTSIVWLRNVSEAQRPNEVRTVFCQDTKWPTVLQRICGGGFRSVDCGDLDPVRSVLGRELETTALDIRRINRITSSGVKTAADFPLLGQALNTLRGRGGTGKTFQLISLARELAEAEGRRVLELPGFRGHGVVTDQAARPAA